MDLARHNHLHFKKTVNLLITTHANQPDGSVRITAMNTGPVRYCYKFQKDECIRKDCSFVQKLMSDREKIDTNYDTKIEIPVSKGKKAEKKDKINSMKDNNSSSNNGMHNNERIPPNTIPFSRAHLVIPTEK